MTANKQIICIISAMFGAMCIESTGIFFWIAVAMIVVPLYFIIRNEIEYERVKNMCENPEYLLDLSTYSVDELNEYTELMA